VEIIEQGYTANIWVWSENGSSDSGDHTKGRKESTVTCIFMQGSIKTWSRFIPPG